MSAEGGRLFCGKGGNTRKYKQVLVGNCAFTNKNVKGTQVLVVYLSRPSLCVCSYLFDSE